MSQVEVRAEFIEDVESADTYRASGRLGKERRVITWGLVFLLRVVVWCTCLLWHPGTKMSV